MILTENELFAQFVLLSGWKIYFFWQKYTSQTKCFFGSLSNWSLCICPTWLNTVNSNIASRCLEPGKYAVHLERWLAHYPASRLVIVDGEQLRGDPVSVMAGLQHKLHLSPVHDYSRSLYFDKVKGFYCMKSEGQGKCLGKDKGRVEFIIFLHCPLNTQLLQTVPHFML